MDTVKRFTILAILSIPIGAVSWVLLASFDFHSHRVWMDKEVTREANFKESEMGLWSVAVDAGYSEDGAMVLAAAMWTAHRIDLNHREAE